MPTTQKIVYGALEEGLYAEGESQREESLKLARRLERAQGQNSAQHRLAAKLSRCKPNRRCGSPACPQCAGAEQALLASTTAEFTASFAGELDLAFVTIIPPNCEVGLGELRLFDFQNFKRRVRDGLAGTNAVCAVGALDLTVNEHRDARFEAHWAPHAHLIAITRDMADFELSLRAKFPRSDESPRPVVVKPLNGDPRVFSYVYETAFARRISVEAAERFDRRSGTTRLCLATTYDRLRASEAIEAAMFLETLGLGGRMLLRNARLYPFEQSVRFQLLSI
jgi:hypothetical protein